MSGHAQLYDFSVVFRGDVVHIMVIAGTTNCEQLLQNQPSSQTVGPAAMLYTPWDSAVISGN